MIKLADPTDKTRNIYAIHATLDQLKSVANIAHTISTIATALNVKCEIVDTFTNALDFISKTDYAFHNGQIQKFENKKFIAA